jgi:hypothetical protein
MNNGQGQLNTHGLGSDSFVTGFGKHSRVIAFCPDEEGLCVRVDIRDGLREPTVAEILKVVDKICPDNNVEESFSFESKEYWEMLFSIDYQFKRIK